MLIPPTLGINTEDLVNYPSASHPYESSSLIYAFFNKFDGEPIFPRFSTESEYKIAKWKYEPLQNAFRIFDTLPTF